MSDVALSVHEGVATIRIQRGKVNALIDPLIVELTTRFDACARDPGIRGVVLTGHGSFFSFGFDIPSFLSYSKEEFTRFLNRFTGFYRQLYLFPKPVVGALNGHTIAGGCMISLACDRLLMVPGGAKISLNEIGFGASVFAGCVAMLRERVGGRSAEAVLFGGAMYDACAAVEVGLVDEVVEADELENRAQALASDLGSRDAVAYASIKTLLRGPVARDFAAAEPASIREFVEIWYSEPTWKRLKKIEIR